MERDGVLNGLILDADTNCIRIGVGATGWMEIVFDNIDEGVLNPETDVLVFSAEKVEGPKDCKRIIGSVNGFIVTNTVDEDTDNAWYKICSISVNDDGHYCAIIGFSNADTREIGKGKYKWNAVLVTDPEYDEHGAIIVDDEDDVVPIYLDGERPDMIVEEVGYVVQ